MKILFVNCCMGDESRTLRLCRTYLHKIKNLNPQAKMEEIDLFNICPDYLNKPRLLRREKLMEEQKYDDETFELARQFSSADYIVIGAPFWDKSFPAVLKAYFENLSVLGITFKYTDSGSVGLCKANNLTYIYTSGGYVGENNCATEYVKQMSEFFGIKQFKNFSAQGLDIEGNDVDLILRDAEKTIAAASI